MDPLFGQHVKRLREARSLTQEQLAERSDLAPDTIRRLEHQDFSPSLKTLRKVCRGLKISLTTLFASFELSHPHPVVNDIAALLGDRSEATCRAALRLLREFLDGLDER
uniref:helix-turn-helix domain-containing protein n=1 Tax=Enhygromyxa salina TaxID=215803 RepID=UPI0021593F57|nr:helix-turn-helix transcriptional regulator [Enhygromyxa salina]